jgi:flagellar biosynthesis/type III secretory pathway chaperone
MKRSNLVKRQMKETIKTKSKGLKRKQNSQQRSKEPKKMSLKKDYKKCKDICSKFKANLIKKKLSLIKK